MIVVIGGPTAIGKTALSIRLAKVLNGEVINADSMQVYKGLDVGTAKVSALEKQGVKHHLLDIALVTDFYTVYQYQKDAREKIAEIKKRGHIPILVGGTGLYLKAALFDYHFLKETGESLIDYDAFTNDMLYQRILAYDPTTTVDRHNRRRLLRALSRLEQEGVLPSEVAQPFYDDVIWIGLKAPRELLYERIDERVDLMLIDLVDEVKSFYVQGIRCKALDTGIGYKELYDFFDGKCSFRASVEAIKQNSRNYAKRQFTFFEHQLPMHWVDSDLTCFDHTVQEVLAYILEQKK